jgi:hypothetical protein
MAVLTKSRARKPLAEDEATFAWTNYEANPNSYCISVSTDEVTYKLNFKPNESLAFVQFYAAFETFDRNKGSGTDRRSLPEQLRALADKIEAGV